MLAAFKIFSTAGFYLILCFLPLKALATSPTRYSFERRRPPMLLFSDLHGGVTMTYQFEKHWDDQSISTWDGARLGRYGSFLGSAPALYGSLSRDLHLGLQAQWYLYDIAVLVNAQYDFFRTESGKFSTGVMYKGSLLVLVPSVGLQLAFYQMLFKPDPVDGFGLDAVVGMNARYLDHEFTEVTIQGVPSPQASFNNYVGVSSIFLGATAAWKVLLLRGVLGVEFVHAIQSASANGNYNRRTGPYLWVESGLRF